MGGPSACGVERPEATYKQNIATAEDFPRRTLAQRVMSPVGTWF